MGYYLFLYLIIYVSVTFILPSWRVWRQTGINPFVVPKDDSAEGFIGKIFKLLIALVFVAVGVHAFAPGFEPYLLPFWYLQKSEVGLVGLVLLHLSLLLIVAAQWQMKHSWRIGIDEKNKTALVTGGLFRFSRNPIFLGMLLTMLGLFLVLPNVLTLVAFVMSWTVLQVQIRLEEVFLKKSHGPVFEDYCRNTRRWM